VWPPDAAPGSINASVMPPSSAMPAAVEKIYSIAYRGLI
jgi:hypothetical protein